MAILGTSPGMPVFGTNPPHAITPIFFAALTVSSSLPVIMRLQPDDGDP